MEVGECRWDTASELRTCCKLSLKLHSGHKCFTAGKTPLATATLAPDGETLFITIRADRVAEVIHERRISDRSV